MVISRDHPTPLYIQIAEALKVEILNGNIPSGGSLGSQKKLEELYQVSKITIRQAIQILENEGLVVTKQGKGSFVKPSKVRQDLRHLQSLSDIIEESGFKPKVTIMKMEKIQVPKNLMHLVEGSDCYYFERLHMVEEKTIAFSKIYLPEFIGEKLTIPELEKHTIYYLLEEKFHIPLGEAYQTIEACPADHNLAIQLKVPEGSPLLKAERLTFDNQLKFIEKIDFYYRYDEFAFKIRLSHGSQLSLQSTSAFHTGL